MPSTPNSGYTPLPSRPRPLPVLAPAAGAQYSVVTHSNNPPNKRTVSGRFWGERSFLGACSIFGVLGEIVPRRDLGQHPSHDLIGQVLKGSMNMSFQISELRRLVSQLGDPLPLLFLQLLLYLAQHLANAFHYGPALPLHTHFHTPPAIHGVQLVCHLHKPQFIPNRF
jgi:hypothetical protein